MNVVDANAPLAICLSYHDNIDQLVRIMDFSDKTRCQEFIHFLIDGLLALRDEISFLLLDRPEHWIDV